MDKYLKILDMKTGDVEFIVKYKKIKNIIIDRYY
jgi:hypothetical protein